MHSSKTFAPLASCLLVSCLLAVACTDTETSTTPDVLDAAPAAPAEGTAIAPQEPAVEVAAPDETVEGAVAEIAPEAPEITEALPEGDVAPALAPRLGQGVRRAALSRRIVDREPEEVATHFAGSPGRLYAFFELSNPSEEDRAYTVRFEGPNGRSSGHVTLRVPAARRRWRTWAWTAHAQTPGSWEAQLVDESGEVVAALPFEIED